MAVSCAALHGLRPGSPSGRLPAGVDLFIEDAQGGSDKYIEGYFVNKYNVHVASGNANAPNFGAVDSKTKLLN